MKEGRKDEGRKDGRMDGWTDGRRDGGTEGRKEGKTEGQKERTNRIEVGDGETHT